MWNRHIKVPKFAPELLFPVSVVNCSDKMLFSHFSVLIKSIYLKQVQIGIKVIINHFYILQALQTLNSTIYLKFFDFNS